MLNKHDIDNIKRKFRGFILDFKLGEYDYLIVFFLGSTLILTAIGVVNEWFSR